MNLDPRDRKSWQGFLELLQPPVGYRLAAAIGTSFGLTVEALTAALLSMSDADGETLADEPVAGVMAITRLRNRVRVLVHPATISASTKPGTSKFVALLDRLIVEVQPRAGLFHPKVWALRFERTSRSPSSDPDEIGRVLVCSRNLSTSTSFELAACFDGRVAADESASPFGSDVAEALRSWVMSSGVRVPEPVWQLPRFIRQLAFEIPHDAKDALRLQWQGLGRPPLAATIPQRLERAVVVSPFLRPDFVLSLLSRTNNLRVVSIPESLDALDDETFAKIESFQAAQGTPLLYQVNDHGDPEGGYLDGVHAKLLLTEDARQNSATYVGSANGTGPGWGVGGPANIEAMVEMRPGIGIDRFVTAFLRENKTKVHPWIMEYDRTSRTAPDSLREAERQMLAALREVAKVALVVRYDAAKQRLALSRLATKSLAKINGGIHSFEFHLAPLLLSDQREGWRPVDGLAKADFVYEDVSIEKLTAFLVLRARSKQPPLERTRLVLARLEVEDSDLERRDAAIRQDIMASADPAAVLAALVRGLAHLRTQSPLQGPGGTGHSPAVRHLLGETTLENLLQAVAMEPSLVAEMRLLLGPIGGTPFQRLCDDLEEVIHQVSAEMEL